MLRLRPYKPCDAAIITSWLKTEYAFRQWSADRYERYPITAADMNAYYDRDRESDETWGMTAFDRTGVVGHLTMRFPDSERQVIRFGFVIVDDSRRKKGYGKEMLSLAVQFAFEILRVDRISLGVFENNTAALKCYQSCGFAVVEPAADEEKERYECMGEVWDCVEMELRRDDFYRKNRCAEDDQI